MLLRPKRLHFGYSTVEIVEICLKVLRVGSTRERQLHLGMSCMTLPYFASLAHCHYQRSVYLHLHTMSRIHMTHPGLNKHFMNGLHIIRRSDRFWDGLSLDLVIEQDLMRSPKTSKLVGAWLEDVELRPDQKYLLV